MMERLKKNMKPTLVLGAICIIVAALLAAVNLIADPIIKDRDAKAALASLTEVMPDGDFDTTPDTLRPDAPKTVKAVYTDKNGGGYVVLLTTTKGYTGNEISITVAIGTDGKIINAAVTKNDESIKNIIVPGGTYGESYKGVGADGLSDLVTGATVKYTEAAIKAAIYDAFSYLGFAEGELEAAPDETEKPEITLLRPEDEVITEIKTLTGATDATDITPGWGRPYNMPKLYKLGGELGYAAYLVTLGWGDYPVSEGIVHIGTDGEVKALKMLTWTPGYDKEKFDAPPPFTDAIVESYIGKDFWHIEDAELVSSATGTSTDFRSAVYDALRYITTNLVERSDEKVLELAKELIPFAERLEPAEISGMPETVKRLYKVHGAKGGYLAHVEVIDKQYQRLATEALVYFDESATVGAVKLLTWNVGHGVEPGDFAEGFVGKNKDNIGDVPLVSAATRTAEDFRAAMSEIAPLIPTSRTAPTVVGIVLLSLSFVGFIAALIYFKRRNRAK